MILQIRALYTIHEIFGFSCIVIRVFQYTKIYNEVFAKYTCTCKYIYKEWAF